MVLAIGLVVDDAIVVVENVYRHIEEGMDGFHAAIRGAREIAFPIISMTLTLAAVYAPIGFMTGLNRGFVHRICFYASRCGYRFRYYCAHLITDDVLKIFKPKHWKTTLCAIY